jgi:hypothetical protein
LASRQPGTIALPLLIEVRKMELEALIGAMQTASGTRCLKCRGDRLQAAYRRAWRLWR